MLPVYPLFLHTQNVRCVVVGGGKVGCRKLAELLDCGISEALVIDLHPASEELKQFLADSRVCFEQREFQPADLDCTPDVAFLTLVFAATSDATVNADIVAACTERRVLCNSATAPDTSGFIVPGRVSRGRLTVAVSSGGASPALSRRLRRELDAFLAPYEKLTELLARLRPHLLALGRDSGHNKKLFRAVVDSPLSQALTTGDAAHCAALLRELLPAELHEHITELLHDLV